MGDDLSRQVREDRQVVLAIGGGDIATAPAGLQVMLAHQASQFLVVGDDALLAQRSLHAAIAIGLEAVADRYHSFDERGIVEAHRRTVVEGRACDPHQTASFGDGDATGPVVTKVDALLGRGACFRAPFRNSISKACLPTSRSSAAILAS